ncbi:hypothetical protein DSO57_1036277 [Entomophthora muscae]|uniref:Uncharacterized protein n=1 Tax=Entomophthora muscae TaxID=34485 RepID=A0ACC2SC06_9FUNG|nr:hypothetical protein DSO57_1036277 [Entomophthora muscae]
MFTKPKVCCCCFSLRTGTLILATLNVIGFLLLAYRSFAGASDAMLEPAILYASVVLCSICALLNIWFLVGAAKKNSRVVNYFSIFILINLVISTIISVLNSINTYQCYKKQCTLEHSPSECEKLILVPFIVGFLIGLGLNYLLNFHFYFSVKGYAKELKAPEQA